MPPSRLPQGLPRRRDGKFRGQSGKSIKLALRVPALDEDIFTLDITQPVQPLCEGIDEVSRTINGASRENSDAWNTSFCIRAERPRHGCAGREA